MKANSVSHPILQMENNHNTDRVSGFSWDSSKGGVIILKGCLMCHLVSKQNSPLTKITVPPSFSSPALYTTCQHLGLPQLKDNQKVLAAKPFGILFIWLTLADTRKNFRVWTYVRILMSEMEMEGMRQRGKRELSISVRHRLQSNRDILGVQFLFAWAREKNLIKYGAWVGRSWDGAGI